MMFLFAPASTVFVEFEEVEGESEERRKARLGRHQRIQERAVCVFPSYQFSVSLFKFFMLFTFYLPV